MFTENYAMLGYPASSLKKAKAPTEDTPQITTTNKIGIVMSNNVSVVQN
jgi:hypothetical protein